MIQQQGMTEEQTGNLALPPSQKLTFWQKQRIDRLQGFRKVKTSSYLVAIVLTMAGLAIVLTLTR